jgi:mevalonate pyrophosphate decarboxylase
MASRIRKYARKNLMVDDEKVKALAKAKGTSESEAVRDAVAFALAAEEIAAAIRELHDLGGIDDVFGRLPPEDEPSGESPGS